MQVRRCFSVIPSKLFVMSFVKIWVHIVWGTKNRQPILESTIRRTLFEHMKKNAREKQLYLDSINGHLDHVHCLLALNADMPVAKTVQLLKGESAFWANKQGLVKTKLEWAAEYFAVSVSESVVDKVRAYIAGQEEHHSKITFTDEYQEFLKRYNFLVQG